MKALFGIILFHLVILIRTQASRDKTVPYGSVFFFTLLLVAYVVFLMMTIDEPEQIG